MRPICHLAEARKILSALLFFHEQNPVFPAEDVLYEHLCNGLSAEELAVRFPTLGQEQIYATVLYYLQNREKIDNYLNEWIEHGKRMRESQEKNPPPVILTLRKIAPKKKFHI